LLAVRTKFISFSTDPEAGSIRILSSIYFGVIAMKILVIALSMALFSIAPVYAGSCGGAPHSHGVSKGEAKGYFDKTDANKDGKVSKSEFDASPASAKVKSFEKLKPGADGLVSKREFIEGFAKHARSN
tara:strand:+ start:35 stop:421 length:387 start_codon:yes stop_codon:yes gene_type:complete